MFRNKKYSPFLTIFQRPFFLLILFFLSFSFVHAQIPIDVDQLSDAQLMQYLNTANLSGLSETDLEAKARQKGLSEEQITKLKARVVNLQVKNGSANPTQVLSNLKSNNVSRRPVDISVPSSSPFSATSAGLSIFGAELFSNSNLTFEPNLKIATPRNYVLGVEDELKIDVFGYSQASFALRVTPEGVINVPNLGPIKVLGLTIEDAQKKIRQALLKNYPGIVTGNTSLQISLNQIRTIRITLIGEISRPGTYSISSLATIANALYVSGGPGVNGSFRDIQLIRNGKPIVMFDLYDFLTKGDLKNNLLLQDDDIIRVNPYKIRVSLAGAVKHPAIFEAKNGETLGSILNYAGGFTDGANKQNIRVTRLGAEEKELLLISDPEYSSFLLRSGDSYFIDNILNRYKNRVTINGAVFYPGDYSIDNISSLKELLLKAGLKEDAYKERAVLRRLQDNFTPQIINFNVNDILAGNGNIQLKREDEITVASIFSLREKYTISIDGEVNKPGTYEYADSIKLQDIILIAGGFRDAASAKKIEISRRIRDGNEKDTSVYAVVDIIDLNKNIISNGKTEGFSLEPYDIINVRKDPSYREQITVTIEGEVLYPGQYVIIRRDESVSDLITRAGGLRNSAYAEGAVLLRNTFQNTTEQALVENKMDLINNTRSDSGAKQTVIKSLTDPQKLVGIHLEQIIASPHSSSDLLLEEGDVLRIPKKLETVQAFGAVYVPKKVVYTNGITFKEVIRESGGFTLEALRRRSYVVYPNGEIKSTKKTFLFFRKYPLIKPGTEIYVPLKREKKGLSTQEVLGLTGAVVGIAGLIIGILNVTKN